jgi:hypothetical protein
MNIPSVHIVDKDYIQYRYNYCRDNGWEPNDTWFWLYDIFTYRKEILIGEIIPNLEKNYQKLT